MNINQNAVHNDERIMVHKAKTNYRNVFYQDKPLEYILIRANFRIGNPYICSHKSEAVIIRTEIFPLALSDSKIFLSWSQI